MKFPMKSAHKVTPHNTKNGRLAIPYQPSLIEHNMDGEVIHQRPVDGYINATAMCRKAGKQWNNYWRNASTKEYMDELSAETRIRVSELVHIIKGGNNQKEQGVWVHPDVAIHLGQWLSPKFAVQVTKWVKEWLSGNISGNMPAHLRRYVANMHKIPNGYFSMLNEAVYSLIAPLEQRGYVLPAKLMPDISYGRMFSDFLREKGITPEDFPEYSHEFVDGKRPPVTCRLYPNKYLGEFRDYLSNVWIPQKAIRYFQARDKKAIPYIQDLIGISYEED